VVCRQEGAHGEIDKRLGQSARVTRDLLCLLPHAAAVLVVSRRRAARLRGPTSGMGIYGFRV